LPNALGIGSFPLLSEALLSQLSCAYRKWMTASPIPSVFKEGWLRLKKIPFLSGADGVVSNFKQNKERYASS
jgi:hypothetical protein